MGQPNDQPQYLLIAEVDNAIFCRRVNEALADGYQLHGPTTFAFDGERLVSGQAVVRPPKAFIDGFPPELRTMMGGSWGEH
jgi:hypothetical protein